MMTANSKKLLSIDLFAGAGGLSEGTSQAGFYCIFANEIDQIYASSYEVNHPLTEITKTDIRDISPAKIRKGLDVARGELSLLAGGPPCQGFSINAPIRSEEDKRNHLFLYFLDFVREFQPKAILIENVPGIVSFSRGKTVRSILSALSSEGYNSDIRILYAAHYYVPQMRWRTIIIGLKDGDPLACYPSPECDAPARPNFTSVFDGVNLVFEINKIKHMCLPKHTTVGEAIHDLPSLENGGGEEEMPYSNVFPISQYAQSLRSDSKVLYNHKCSGLGKVNLERMQFIPVGGSWRDIPFDILPKGMKRARRSDHTRRYGRLDPESIASTVMTKCDPHWGTFFHYNQDRVISVREAARIQSFPDRCRFIGSLRQQYEQVGNAVPPIFAKTIASQIRKFLQGEKFSSIMQKRQLDLFKENDHQCQAQA